MSDYSDIRNQKRPESKYPKMRREDRAKLFAPFDALNGFGSAIKEKDLIFLPRPILSEDEKGSINETLCSLERGMEVHVIYFLPIRQDADGEAGEYITASGLFLKADELGRKLVLDCDTIPMDDIMSIFTTEGLEGLL